MSSETSYDPKDLIHFPDIGEEAPELWRKFLDWYNAASRFRLAGMVGSTTVTSTRCLTSVWDPKSPKTIQQANLEELAQRVIQVGRIALAVRQAGSGSNCGGATM